MKSLISLALSVNFIGIITAAEPVTWTRFGGPTANFTLNKSTASTPKAILWKVPLGLGESSIMGDGTRLYTMQGNPDAADKTKGTESVLALDPTNGKILWEHKYPVTGLPKGETPLKGGRCGPQGSVCLFDGLVFSSGYTGKVFALDAKTGAVVWQKDLVADYGGVSPEFGFSSSPVPCENFLLIPVGGTKTSLVAVEPKTGKEIWRTEPERASYCTPQVVTLAGQKQIVQLTRNKLNGFSIETGKTLWSSVLPLEGLTNVPSPLVLSEDRIVISGQGVKGIKMLKVTSTNGVWAVQDVWKNSPEFFYCNWMVKGTTLYGSTKQGFVGINLADGETVTQYKPFKDANMLKIQDKTIVQRADGALVTVELSESSVKELQTLELNKQRTWTPPSVVGSVIYVRTKTELIAVGLE